MCGISLYICKNNTNNDSVINVLNSLFELQNRGYDSFGIAYFNEKTKNYEINKKCIDSTNQNIYDDFYKKNHAIKSSTCIGHSRWATHGQINVENAHPHISNENQFILIHNGIIENYKELKEFLITKKYTFYSETDSEVIVNLIEYFYLYERNQNVKESIYHAISLLQGTYGLIILDNNDPNVAYTIKNGSPLLISDNSKEIIATSELSGFINKTSNYYELNNKELVILSASKGILFDAFTTNMKYINSDFQEKYLTKSLENYSHYTQKEILEQDKTLWMSLNQGARISNNKICLGGLQKLGNHLSKIKNIVFIGCGSSYYASCIGYNYIQKNININDVNVYYFDGGNFDNDEIPLGICLFVFISQSGETMDLIKVINKLPKNHYTMAIVNVIDSTISKEVQCGIYMNIGKEVAVASTKSFTSSLLLLKLFSLWLFQEKSKMNNSKKDICYIQKLTYEKNKEIITEDINNINQLVYQVKKMNNEMNIILEQIKLDHLLYEHIFIIGKGSMEYISKECALKLKEICYIHGEGMNASSLRHGPIAMIRQGFPVILLINHENIDKMMNVYNELVSRKAYTFIITSMFDLKSQFEENENCSIIFIPNNKSCSEILFSITIQHLCYEIAIRKKINPDKPRNLAKVVSVE